MKLHTAVAMLAISASSVALADLVTASGSRSACKISTSTIQATSAPESRLAPSRPATQPSINEMRWSWMPVQGPSESPRTAALVAVPAPGAAALIGLSALLVSRRRA